MANYDAYGTVLKIGTAQIETAVVVVTTITAGNANFILTAANMANSPITTSVALANNDTASQVAVKAAATMNLDSDITAWATVVAEGPNVIVTLVLAAANDGTLNLEYADNTSAGLTDDATSNDTLAGAALAAVAQVTNIGGPSFSADTVDVTTHDSTNAWEETVVSVIRSGDLTLDIIYDPADDTHDATGGNGLLTRISSKTRTDFSLVFPDAASSVWGFNGEVTGFESGAGVADALTASITIKLTGSPLLV